MCKSFQELLYLKFRLLADYADYIVGVSEHDSGGFLVEQGYFTALEQYFEKTDVFKRTYEDLTPADLETEADPENPYSGMQTAIFEMLADGDRLCVWETEDELRECTSELP
ncbi:hypothetical protein HTG_02720 [Natrinema mahii]|nr:hypothetical protein HTG_02720 [Natrinema mahii]